MKDQNEDLTLRRKDKYLLFIYALACLFICIFIFLALLSIEVKGEQVSRSEHLLAASEKATKEMNSTITSLNALKLSQCDKSTLMKMRKALFEANYIKDIGFFQNDILICTTGLGVLDSIVVKGSPDFTDNNGYDIWPHHQVRIFDEPIYALLVSKGDFNVIVEISDFEVSYLAPYRYEVTRIQGENSYYFMGNDSLFENEKFNFFQVNYYQNCSNTTSNCVTLYLPLNELFIIYKYWLMIICLVSLLLTAAITSKLKSILISKHSIAYRIKVGLDNGGFYWVYQPIVELSTGKVIGCEVLSRFKDKDGYIDPEQFIPIIRARNKTWQFTKCMVAHVVTEFGYNHLIPDNFRISFNLFPSDLIDNRTSELNTIVNLQHSRFKIVLEITEDEYLDESLSQVQLFQLKQDGFLLAVDDFGTGYANLMQLKKAPFEYIKIDRTFVNEIEKTSIKSSLIPSVIDIAGNLNMDVVAEGIENEKQRELLASLGVQYGQGWQFGRPGNIENLIVLIKQGDIQVSNRNCIAS